MNLNHLRVFVSVAKQGSLLKASKELSVPNSTVGRQLSQLEEELGTTLVFRNTRHLRLTEEGYSLYERSAALLQDLEEIENDIKSLNGGLSGKIRIAIPNEFGAMWLSQCIADYCLKHTSVSIECITSMASLDPIRRDVDVSISYHRGKAEDSSLIMKSLLSIPSIVVAAPRLLERHGKPTTVAEISNLPCISTLDALKSNPWHFIDQSGNCHSLNLSSRYRVDSSSMLISGAVSGIGFAIIPKEFCHEHVKEGRLIPIDLDMVPAPLEIVAFFPSRHISNRTRALVNEVQKFLSNINTT